MPEPARGYPASPAARRETGLDHPGELLLYVPGTDQDLVPDDDGRDADGLDLKPVNGGGKEGIPCRSGNIAIEDLKLRPIFLQDGRHDLHDQLDAVAAGAPVK